MIRIAIVEDEKIASEQLEGFLSKYGDETGYSFDIKIFDNPIAFLQSFKSDFDIIFMDIEMPDMNGIDVSRKIREIDESVIIIFVTNMAQFAVNGYEVNALDFIIKPVTYYNFVMKIKKAIKISSKKNNDLFSFPIENGIKRVEISDILYIEVILHKLIYHLISENIESHGSLKDVEDKLFGYGFRRCNHCYLVNLKYVSEIKNNAIVVGNDCLQVSRPKKKEFLNSVANYFSGGNRYGR